MSQYLQQSLQAEEKNIPEPRKKALLDKLNEVKKSAISIKESIDTRQSRNIYEESYVFDERSPFFPPKTLLEKKMNILWQVASQIYDIDDDTNGEFSRSVTLLHMIIDRMVGQLRNLQLQKHNDDELTQLENELKKIK